MSLQFVAVAEFRPAFVGVHSYCLNTTQVAIHIDVSITAVALSGHCVVNNASCGLLSGRSCISNAVHAGVSLTLAYALLTHDLASRHRWVSSQMCHLTNVQPHRYELLRGHNATCTVLDGVRLSFSQTQSFMHISRHPMPMSLLSSHTHNSMG